MLDLRLSSFLWNEAITLIGTQTALIYYLIPFLVEYWPTFLNQAIVLTQIISMVIIITGLLLTNKKSMTFRFIKTFIPGSRIINATSILLFKHSLPSNTKMWSSSVQHEFIIRARNEILAVGYSYFYHFVKSELVFKWF
jgi:hypothetical protein